MIPKTDPDANSRPRKKARVEDMPVVKSSKTLKRKAEPRTPDAAENTEMGLTRILKIEHTVRKLQDTLKNLISEAPTATELARYVQGHGGEDEVLITLARNNTVKLAASLKTMHDEGKLNLFDRIITFDDASQVRAVEGEAVPELHAELAACVPTLAAVMEFDSVSGLPPIPPIHDQHLRARVFMHKSVVSARGYLSKEEMLATHNERLEFLGDSVMNNVITILIYERFPYMNEGDMSKLRTLLICNETLTKWALDYGLDKELKINIPDATLRSGKMKIFADIFEAYIGALALQENYDTTVIKRWLSQLADDALAQKQDTIQSVEKVDTSSKGELYALIGSAKNPPEYIATTTGDGYRTPFVVECRVQGDLLGRGEGNNMKDAGFRAALSALRNKPMIEKWSLIRRQTPRAETGISDERIAKTLPRPVNVLGASGFPGVVSSPAGNKSLLLPPRKTASLLPPRKIAVAPVASILATKPPGTTKMTAPSSTETQAPVTQTSRETSTGFDSSVDTKLPIVTSSDEKVPCIYRERLYALLGKNRIGSNYEIVAINEGFKADLYVKGMLVASSLDISKKKAGHRAAKAFLDALKSDAKLAASVGIVEK
ncbi:hypothetical protein BABINDRAFT_162886 [Babjeviella inositovora NRRL Y-12698]|uniref:ribonuclease III n=1 Tax=Babjeviella inositovora NRRL Y-12698 TaxID=984486 RepID=A0A1E3QMB1_9ASCO|nr:uncharacterized protein BABINDRAFT_162886 [Babjeviella inositovora NRRL Y-12698]ODQ78222.1 hypothetical protein BABINDRAFT_162886 [Babjeviella inositovora NRRL Y-12698]